MDKINVRDIEKPYKIKPEDLDGFKQKLKEQT